MADFIENFFHSSNPMNHKNLKNPSSDKSENESRAHFLPSPSELASGQERGGGEVVMGYMLEAQRKPNSMNQLSGRYP